MENYTRKNMNDTEPQRTGPKTTITHDCNCCWVYLCRKLWAL